MDRNIHGFPCKWSVPVSSDTQVPKPVKLWKTYFNICLHFPSETKRQKSLPLFLTSQGDFRISWWQISIIILNMSKNLAQYNRKHHVTYGMYNEDYYSKYPAFCKVFLHILFHLSFQIGHEVGISIFILQKNKWGSVGDNWLKPHL